MRFWSIGKTADGVSDVVGLAVRQQTVWVKFWSSGKTVDGVSDVVGLAVR